VPSQPERAVPVWVSHRSLSIFAGGSDALRRR